MVANSLILALAATIPNVIAAPNAPITSGLRLVKTSATLPAQWIHERDIFDRFVSKRIGFVDITDIKDEEVLAALSTEDSARMVTRAARFPNEAKNFEQGWPLVQEVSNAGPQSWLKTLSDFHTRYYKSQTGVQAANWIMDQAKKLGAANPAITVKPFKHQAFQQPSIIAQIPGQSSDLVVVGAHLDSITRTPEGRSPGAEDDGSGAVVVMEALRVLAAKGWKPKHTIEFHWYAGEEAGLLGSKDVWANYKATGKKVVSYLNQDMAGYSPSNLPAIFDDHVDAELSNFLMAIIRDYFNIMPNRSKCGYGCSDHASVTANGFPAAFIADDTFDKAAKFIHSEQDSYDKIMWPTILQHSQIVVSYLVEASLI